MNSPPSTASAAPGPAGPFLSVVVTAYRRRQFVLEAVRSVLSQQVDRSAYEVIVLKDFVDDAIDGALAAEAPTVRVHTEDLRRMGDMIAKGVELARGEVVCFLEDDDRFRPGKLAAVRERFRASPDLAYLRNAYGGIDVEGRPIASWARLRPPPPRSTEISPRGANLAFVFRYGVAINLSTMAVRRAVALPWLDLLRRVPASPDLFVFVLAAVSGRRMWAESAVWNDYRVHASTSHGAIAEGQEADDLADTRRSKATAQVMEQLRLAAPGHRLADRFAACYHREVEATLYLLDPSASWSARGWLGFVRTALWRRQRYLGAIAVFAVYRSLRPDAGSRAYRRWRHRTLRSAAGGGAGTA